MSDNVNSSFPATAWTMIEGAKGEGDDAKKSLSALCDVYWAPVFGFISRRIRNSHDAEDVTNNFFISLLQNPALIDKADRTRGKFRSYLSQRLKWFLMDRNKRTEHVKVTESGYLPEIAVDPTDDFEFKVSWAKRTLERALDNLEDRYRFTGNEARRQVFIKRRTGASASEIATALNLSTDKVKNELREIKKDSETSLRELVIATGTDESLVDEEIAEIRRLITSPPPSTRLGRRDSKQPVPEPPQELPSETYGVPEATD
jgi:RNA polymerase sigma-70 factor (ECF subfamily)